MDIEKVLEKVTLLDDLSLLSDEERWAYYRTVCEKFELDPSTRPFAYITFEDTGRMKLYALRNATDQLRKVHGISVSIVRQDRMGDYVYTMTARAKTIDGRIDEAIGAVPLRDEYNNLLSPRQISNAIMTCQTKAIRRATLSICGISLLDESEVADIPTANTSNQSLWENPLIDSSPTNEESKSIDGLEEPPNIEEETTIEIPPLTDETPVNEGVAEVKAPPQYEWLEGKAEIISIEKEFGEKNEAFHRVKMKDETGNELEAFAITQLSETLEQNPIFNGTEVFYRGKIVKKGILLYGLQIPS